MQGTFVEYDVQPGAVGSICGHWWQTAGEEHTCLDLIQRRPHVCRCCCGAADWTMWDRPARLTPGLRARRKRRASR